ncbi:MAG TPA: DUF4129 domain-containing protein [Planctomycetaceae bacterium]|nr:DUF4129 domain-containing protein [Planctomycetaceae bacterium]
MTVPGSLIAVAILGAQSGGPLPDPQTVRQTAREVLARPEYRLDAPQDFSDAIAQFWAMIRRVIEAIQSWFDWLYGMSPVLAFAIVLAMIVCVCLLLGHILWTLVTVVRGDRRALDALADLSRRKVDPAELAREADDAGARGNYILGVRLLYRACLARLEEAEEKPFRPGATNREHLHRYRATPLYDWLARLVSVIDLKWYGDEPCLASDFAECRDAYERVSLLARGSVHAHHA